MLVVFLLQQKQGIFKEPQIDSSLNEVTAPTLKSELTSEILTKLAKSYSTDENQSASNLQEPFSHEKCMLQEFEEIEQQFELSGKTGVAKSKDLSTMGNLNDGELHEECLLQDETNQCQTINQKNDYECSPSKPEITSQSPLKLEETNQSVKRQLPSSLENIDLQEEQDASEFQEIEKPMKPLFELPKTREESKLLNSSDDLLHKGDSPQDNQGKDMAVNEEEDSLQDNQCQDTAVNEEKKIKSSSSEPDLASKSTPKHEETFSDAENQQPSILENPVSQREEDETEFQETKQQTEHLVKTSETWDQSKLGNSSDDQLDKEDGPENHQSQDTEVKERDKIKSSSSESKLSNESPLKLEESSLVAENILPSNLESLSLKEREELTEFEKIEQQLKTPGNLHEQSDLDITENSCFEEDVKHTGPGENEELSVTQNLQQEIKDENVIVQNLSDITSKWVKSQRIKNYEAEMTQEEISFPSDGIHHLQMTAV